jgi:hypothetical protein
MVTVETVAPSESKCPSDIGQFRRRVERMTQVHRTWASEWNQAGLLCGLCLALIADIARVVFQWFASNFEATRLLIVLEGDSITVILFHHITITSQESSCMSKEL